MDFLKALSSLPTWACLAIIGVAYTGMGWLDDQPEPAPRPALAKARPVSMQETIAMACSTHGAKGHVNRFGDVQCLKEGRPTYYVIVNRVDE